MHRVVFCSSIAPIPFNEASVARTNVPVAVGKPKIGASKRTLLKRVKSALTLRAPKKFCLLVENIV